uniref:Neprosin PEP catalytic domain-containing protein n=1 Tax=Oryza brachyantha TaxID=4533 RepID=J3N7I2_ORYBR
MGHKAWTMKTFLVLHFLIFSVEATTEEIDKNSNIKTVQTADGQSFAFVNFKSQSLRHPSLKNHTGQPIPPASSFDSIYGDKGSKSNTSDVEMSKIDCPSGTVPILTSYNGSMDTTSFDNITDFKYFYNENANEKLHMAAVATVPSTFYGFESPISVWEPDLGTGRPPRFSGAIIVVQNEGSRVAAGWSIDPRFYGDNHVHLEIAWVDNGRSCVNTRCAGFVQMSKTAAPGLILKPPSTIDGKQYIVRVKIVKFLGDWVLKVGEEIVGYWPSALFTTRMSESADRVVWMGVVGAAPGEPFPPMGSGQPPDDAAETNAACFGEARVIDASRSPVTPELSGIYTAVTAPRCYEVGRPVASDGGLKFYYGGTGCSPGQSVE